MSGLRQFIVILGMNARTSRTRIKSSLVIVFGLTCVVCVLLSVLSLGEGFRIAYLSAGDPGSAIVLSAGTDSERRSLIPSELVPKLLTLPGIRRDFDGSPLADPEIYTDVSLRKLNGDLGYTNIRGIGSKGLTITPRLTLVSGRTPRPGSDDMMVGVTAQRKFPGLEVGDRITFRDEDRITLKRSIWRVVGMFSTGTFSDGDLLVDAGQLARILGQSDYNSVIVRLETPDSLALLTRQAKQEALPVTIERLSTYWQHLFDQLPSTAFIVTYLISALIAMGAVTGTIHVMHGAVAARAREIAVMRALGFQDTPIAASVVAEAMVFACIGAAIGTVIDWAWLQEYAYNGAYGVFRVAVTLRLFTVAIGWALVIALIGALMPSLRTARTSITDAMST